MSLIEAPDYAGLLRAARKRFALDLLFAENINPDDPTKTAQYTGQFSLMRATKQAINYAIDLQRRGDVAAATHTLQMLLQRRV